MIKVSTTGMAVSLKPDLRFPAPGQQGHGRRITQEERLKERQTSIKPLVEEYFAWVKEILENKTLLPKGKAADGLHYSVNQEAYLKLFLTDGEIPIDNSASERALRNFTLGRKNWMTINTIRGAHAGQCNHLQHYRNCQSQQIECVLLHQAFAHRVTEAS